jgi:hypothetical protein
VQRARDRRGRHRQHIHRLAHLLQPLFVRDAKALLFVDDDQAQVGEFHILADEPMRADEDVDLALGRALDVSFCSLGDLNRLMESTMNG